MQTNQTKFLKEVVTSVVGKQTEDIVDLLDGKKNINEFLIAKRLDLTVNQTRNILYRLSNYGLVSSIRKKDKRKGWYTYFWKIETLKCLEFLEGLLLKSIEQLRSQIKSRETKLFYTCEKCNIEFNEENALSKNFICDECGNVFTLRDNSKFLKELKRSLDRTETELKSVRLEISKEKGKIEKKKSAEAKKLIKKKQKIKVKKKKPKMEKPKKKKKVKKKKKPKKKKVKKRAKKKPKIKKLKKRKKKK